MGDAVPVVMISYNRPDLVVRTMKNVFLADESAERDIYMFIDGPRNEADKDRQDEIEQIVSSYQDRLPRLRIIRREKNYGCRGNIVAAITQVINQYGKAIIVEDDILVSRTFFRYMDAALDRYKDDKRIWCINAWRSRYVRMPRTYKHDVYLTRRNMCWGWGTWKDRWEKVDFDLMDWPEFKADAANLAKLDAVGADIKNLIDAQCAGRLKTWDVQCTYHMAKNGYFAVEPRWPLTKNCGFSTPSEHCRGENTAVSRAPYYNFMPQLPVQLEMDDCLLGRLRYSYCNPRLRVRAWRKLLRIWWGWQRNECAPEDVV